MSEPEAAVAIVHAGAPRESILLIRRAERADDSWSGHWSFPGGRRHPEDRDLLHTALRELEEECGIQLPRELARDALAQRMAGRGVGQFVLVAPFVFAVDREVATMLDTREAVESLWVPLSRLRDTAQHSFRPVPGLPAATLFPAIDLGGVPLWGFTYRLIADWLSIGSKPRPETGIEAARRVLDFLAAHGLKQQHGWVDQSQAKVARVSGAIPVAAVLAYFSEARHYLQAVNRLEVSAGRICIAGPDFEEYLILGSETGK